MLGDWSEGLSSRLDFIICKHTELGSSNFRASPGSSSCDSLLYLVCVVCSILIKHSKGWSLVKKGGKHVATHSNLGRRDNKFCYLFAHCWKTLSIGGIAD